MTHPLPRGIDSANAEPKLNDVAHLTDVTESFKVHAPSPAFASERESSGIVDSKTTATTKSTTTTTTTTTGTKRERSSRDVSASFPWAKSSNRGDGDDPYGSCSYSSAMTPSAQSAVAADANNADADADADAGSMTKVEARVVGHCRSSLIASSLASSNPVLADAARLLRRVVVETEAAAAAAVEAAETAAQMAAEMAATAAATATAAEAAAASASADHDEEATALFDGNGDNERDDLVDSDVDTAVVAPRRRRRRIRLGGASTSEEGASHDEASTMDRGGVGTYRRAAKRAASVDSPSLLAPKPPPSPLTAATADPIAAKAASHRLPMKRSRTDSALFSLPPSGGTDASSDKSVGGDGGDGTAASSSTTPTPPLPYRTKENVIQNQFIGQSRCYPRLRLQPWGSCNVSEEEDLAMANLREDWAGWVAPFLILEERLSGRTKATKEVESEPGTGPGLKRKRPESDAMQNEEGSDKFDFFGLNSSILGGFYGLLFPTTPPQQFLNAILSSRRYGTKTLQALPPSFPPAKPSALRVASHGPAVMRAIQTSDVCSLASLFWCGLHPNPCDRFGDNTALSHVCRAHDWILFQLFLNDSGSSILSIDCRGMTPLHHLCASQNTDETTTVAAAAAAAAESLGASNLSSSGSGWNDPMTNVRHIAWEILGFDWRFLRVADARGRTPLELVKRESWAAWNCFLQMEAERHWPHRHERGSALHMRLRREEVDFERFVKKLVAPPADPPNAPSLDMVRSVAAGEMRPEDVVRARAVERLHGKSSPAHASLSEVGHLGSSLNSNEAPVTIRRSEDSVSGVEERLESSLQAGSSSPVQRVFAGRTA